MKNWTPNTIMLQTQDAIAAHLANTLDLQLQQAYVAGVKRTPGAQSRRRGLGSAVLPWRMEGRNDRQGGGQFRTEAL
jgi:hypothetical protein